MTITRRGPSRTKRATESGKLTSTGSKQAKQLLVGIKAEPLPETPELLPLEAVRRVLHKLQVHQIELEMLNEELRGKQEELEVSQKRYCDLFEQAPVGYVTFSDQGLILEANLSATRLLGVVRGDLIKRPMSHFIHPEDQEIFNQNCRQLFKTGKPHVWEVRLIRKDAAPFWVRYEAITAQDAAGATIYRAVVSDIDERRRVDDDLRHANKSLQLVNCELEQAVVHEQQLANTDALTGVNNHRALFERATQMFDVAARYQQPLAVIMFDIDNFKKINDNFGHAVGDRILKKVAHVAVAGLRAADIIGRYGGDEFVIVLPMTTAHQALPIVERIRTAVSAIRAPTPHDDIAITLSIGITNMFHPPQDDTIAQVINRADEAMYQAKQTGRNRSVTSITVLSGKDQVYEDMTTTPLSVESLRHGAEERLQEQAVEFVVPSPEAARYLPHELQMHQIELERQNEELRRVQEELEASRMRCFALYDLAPVGFFTFSDQGLILEANLTAATLMGMARRTLLKQSLTGFIIPEDRDIYCRHLKQLLATGSRQVCELRLVKRNGTQFRARLEAAVAHGADGAPVYRALLSDLTRCNPGTQS